MGGMMTKNLKKKTVIISCATAVIFAFALAIIVYFSFDFFAFPFIKLPDNISKLKDCGVYKYADQNYLPRVCTSRVGKNLESINAIVIHYIGNPGTSAEQNRNYYDNAGVTVNSHFIIGLDGEIIQCLPLWERSSASNDRNKDTISVEVCHPDESGKFTDESYSSLVDLCAWLCDVCGFDSDGIIRHHDITGKICPKWFVEHEDAWLEFKKDVDLRLENGK